MCLNEIETVRLRLRAVDAGDWPSIFAYMSDPRVTTYLPQGRLDEEASRAFALKHSGNQGEAVAVVEKATGKMIGHMPFHAWFASKTYEIGWAIGREHQGKGYATEAGHALLAYAFEVLKAHRVIATCQPENVASCRVAEKLGLRREGHFRACLYRAPGIWWDEPCSSRKDTPKMPDQAWLTQIGLKLVVTAFVMGTIALGGWLLARRLRSRGVVVAQAQAGRTVSSPRIVVLAFLAGMLSLGALAIGLAEGIDDSIPDNRLWWILVVAGFAVAALYAATVAAHRWVWNDSFIEWHGVWRSKRIGWPSIHHYGQDWTGARYVATVDGARIRWSDDTLESNTLDDAVVLHRPDLTHQRPMR